MLHNIKFEINTSIISGKETLLRFLKDNPKKNTGIIIDKNLYRKSNYIKKCLIKAKREETNIFIFYDYKFEPSYQYLDKIMNIIKK